MKANNKTIETKNSVAVFLKKIKDAKRRSDCTTIIEMVSKQTGIEPKMWGTSIVGFGTYHYIYDSGREGDAPLAGLASRANAIVLYLSGNFDKREEMLAKFGKHSTSKGCVYIKQLEDIDTSILVKMFKLSMAHIKKIYPG